jgi:hypothetical protein
MVHRYNERFQLPLGLAVLCLALEASVTTSGVPADARARLRAAWRGRRFLRRRGTVRKGAGGSNDATILDRRRRAGAWLAFTGAVFRDALHESTTGRRLGDAGKAEALAAYGARAEEPDNPCWLSTWATRSWP